MYLKHLHYVPLYNPMTQRFLTAILSESYTVVPSSQCTPLKTHECRCVTYVLCEPVLKNLCNQTSICLPSAIPFFIANQTSTQVLYCCLHQKLREKQRLLYRVATVCFGSKLDHRHTVPCLLLLRTSYFIQLMLEGQYCSGLAIFYYCCPPAKNAMRRWRGNLFLVAFQSVGL